jgi:hypothetical protein
MYSLPYESLLKGTTRKVFPKAGENEFLIGEKRII